MNISQFGYQLLEIIFINATVNLTLSHHKAFVFQRPYFSCSLCQRGRSIAVVLGGEDSTF